MNSRPPVHRLCKTLALGALSGADRLNRLNSGQAICSYQIVKRLRQLVTSNGQGGDAAVICSLLIAGNCQAIIKDGENGEKFLGIFGRGGARSGRLDARRDRRAGGSRLRTEWLSALSAPLAMASWSERQILQYCAVGLRHDRWPASLSLTRGSVLKLPQSTCWLQRLHENSPVSFQCWPGFSFADAGGSALASYF